MSFANKKDKNQHDMVLNNSISAFITETNKQQKKAPIETSDQYQTEAALEDALIKKLNRDGCLYASHIKDEETLLENLKIQIEKLNNTTFSPNEWNWILDNVICKIEPSMDAIQAKTQSLQTPDHRTKSYLKDDGTYKNFYLINKTDITRNTMQVINQYQVENGTKKNRYDCTILVNGLPLVHIELKRRGVELKEAFNQINRYQKESFDAGRGLFEYIQIFVISNGTRTKYYSNTTRKQHVDQMIKGKLEFNALQQTKKISSHSFEFTSWWADEFNKPIFDLMLFADSFLQKHTLIEILTKFCVFTAEGQLLVMRPYQISACKAILHKIISSSNEKLYDKTSGKADPIKAGGYIWHSTGSGKTLTSFKTAQLITQIDLHPEDPITKVVFVVDRKDLDHQTVLEYDKFQPGAANGNSNTKKLEEQLNNPNAKIVITTIQKLSKLLNSPKYKTSNIVNQHVVFIFDECHRSQFGSMHQVIKQSFKKYHMFGFTGTPIFAENTTSNSSPFKTTEQLFGARLHTYTLMDAILDKNVLPFNVEYHKTFKTGDSIDEKEQASSLDKDSAIMSPERVSLITEYILSHFNKKTKRTQGGMYKYSVVSNVQDIATSKNPIAAKKIKKSEQKIGFNSIFAVQSIDAAIQYYTEFKRQQQTIDEDKKLKIAMIYSCGANESTKADDYYGMYGFIDEENADDTSGLSKTHREALDDAIKDYNSLFNVEYSTNGDQFQSYYNDVSLRMKNCEIDILIVVNMFLTGFDATTLNTLWVDKSLQNHGLVQAFSRTNRILNTIKTNGNIVCFRDLEKETEKSFSLFSDKNACGIILIRSYKEYMYGYEEEGKNGEKIFRKGYLELAQEFLDTYNDNEERLISNEEKRQYINSYNTILRLRNILSTFDNFEADDIISDRKLQDYHSIYLDVYNDFRKKDKDVAEVINNEDVVFEMELIKQIDIDIDYILKLIKEGGKNRYKDRTLKDRVEQAIDSSLELRMKKDLIIEFVDQFNPHKDEELEGDIEKSKMSDNELNENEEDMLLQEKDKEGALISEQWNKFIEKKKNEEFMNIVMTYALKPSSLQFISNVFKTGKLSQEGEDFIQIIPVFDLFDTSSNNMHDEIFEKIKAFYEKYHDIASSDFEDFYANY